MPSRSSGRDAAPSRPQRPKSTSARLDAISAFSSSTAALSTAGTVLGMSITVVMPPAAAAAVREPKSSLAGKPGSRLWTWASTPPGSTRSPVASTSSRPGGPPRSSPVTTPPATCTSAETRPSGVQTVPPRRIRSDREIGLPEQRRERDAQPLQVLGRALLPVEHGDQPDDHRPRRPDLLDGIDGGAARGQDVLDHGHAVARLQDALQRSPCAVALGLLAHQYERQVELQRDGAAQQHGAQLGGG